MKSIILTFAIAVFSMSTAFGQVIKAKDFNLNLGIGVGGGWYYGTFTRKYPAMILSGEYAVADEISIGGMLLFSGAYYETQNPSVAYSYRYTYWMFGPRASFHFSELLDIKTDKLDLYAGAQAGLIRQKQSNISVNQGSYNPQTSLSWKGFLAVHVGARYYFNNQFGLYTELALGMPTFSLGMVVRFR